MNKESTRPILTDAMLQQYLDSLREQERSSATVKKYAHDLHALLAYLAGRPVTKELLIAWKELLIQQYAAASVNTCLAAANGLLAYLGWGELRLKRLRVQRELFGREERELSKEEYLRLIRAAVKKKDRRLSLVLQTICATGIRVSELRFITVSAVRTGRAVIDNKGKIRTILLPRKLCRLLTGYLRTQKKPSGPVFTTRTGRALDRSNIWREMKGLCESAGVAKEKVFPHNLRHLFARTYYALEKDISRLADLLGHSSITTTRIYTTESGVVHARQIERMGLITT